MLSRKYLKDPRRVFQVLLGEGGALCHYLDLCPLPLCPDPLQGLPELVRTGGWGD